jgi:TP901 family phage tail tape measure protein
MVLETAITQVAGAVRGLGGAALDFEANMATVGSIARLSSAQLEALKDDVVALSRDPAIREGPAQLAVGLYDVYSSGFQGADGLKVQETAAKAATAGITETAAALRAITAVRNAYGLSAAEAGHVSDVLFQTVHEDVITFEQLANNFGNTVPIAVSPGLSIEELGAAYAHQQSATRDVLPTQSVTRGFNPHPAFQQSATISLVDHPRGH